MLPTLPSPEVGNPEPFSTPSPTQLERGRGEGGEREGREGGEMSAIGGECGVKKRKEEKKIRRRSEGREEKKEEEEEEEEEERGSSNIAK